LRIHSSKHTGEKLFGCELCSQRFSSASYLAVHRRHHTGERKYQCDTCGKGYIESSAYKKHLKTHMGKQDSESTENNATEPDKEEREKETPHIITITEEKTEVQQQPQEQPVQISGPSPKRFKCGLCVKTYMYLHSLKKHMLSHMTEHHHQQQQLLQEQQQQQQQQQQLLSLPTANPLLGLAQPDLNLYEIFKPQPQQLQVQTIQIHPQHQPIQIHAVGVQQVQQQQLHVATSACQTMLPNILQLQPATVAVSGLSQQELSGVAHRIILQQPPTHPALYSIHH
ncbi:Myoneurin, partial [Papilio machaon]